MHMHMCVWMCEYSCLHGFTHGEEEQEMQGNGLFLFGI